MCENPGKIDMPAAMAGNPQGRKGEVKERRHVHEWCRTGPDTLMCWGCQTVIDEPEDK